MKRKYIKLETRLAIFNRDGFKCVYCGQKVYRNIPQGHRRQAVIDHYLSLYLGGKDEVVNYVTSCFFCNSIKGKAVYTAEIKDKENTVSRSENTEIRNPGTRFFQWSGSDGRVKYYDKETKENVFIDLPFTFLVLDKLVTITGYSDEDQSGIWSNEIRNTRYDELTVRTKKGILKRGLYDEVKTITGAKFAQSVYVAFKGDDGTLQIGNFKMSGCAVSAWIEFCKGKDIYDGAIKITESEEGKKGATKFFSPVFEMSKVSDETNRAAEELDKQLQDYLRVYLNRKEEAAAASNESYINQRNAEIAQYDETPTFDVTVGRGEVMDSEIPF